MKRNIAIALFFVISPVTAIAQSLTGRFEGPVSEFGAIFLYQYSIVDHEFISADSVLIRDGGFRFKLTEDKEPRFAYLRLKDRNGKWLLARSVELFLAPDDILLLCEDSLKNTRTFNSPVNYDYLRLREMMAPAREYADRIYLRYMGETKKIPREILDTKEYQQFAMKRLLAARQGIYRAQEAFIVQNPSSWISLYALRHRMQEKAAGAAEMKGLFSQLDKNIRASAGGLSIAKKIEDMNKVTVGSVAPGFQLPNIKGQLVDLQSYRGRYVLLEFWSSGCGPCRIEAPHLKTAFTRFGSSGFDILSISLDDATRYKGKENWLNAVEKDGTGIWQQVSDLKGHQSPVAVQYNVGGIPQNFLVDPDGVIIAKDLRGADLHDYLEKLFGKN
ncbi:redoxin domain-containing protein [Chitinophaga lutea]